MKKMWKFWLRMAWMRVNHIAQIPLMLFSGYYVPFDDWQGWIEKSQ